MTPDYTERVRAIAPQRLDLLLRRLNALRPAPAESVVAAREPVPSGPPQGTWLAEPVLVPLRLFGVLDGAALQGALAALGARPAPPVLNFGSDRSTGGTGKPCARPEPPPRATPHSAPCSPVWTKPSTCWCSFCVRTPARRSPVRWRPSCKRASSSRAVRRRRPRRARRSPTRSRRKAPRSCSPKSNPFPTKTSKRCSGSSDPALLQVARAAGAPVDPASAEALLAEIDQLADDDVEALLRQLSDV